MRNDLLYQVQTAGEKNRDGRYTFHGKGADIVLDGDEVDVVSCSGGFPMVAKIKTLQLLNGYIGVDGEITTDRVESKEGFYEMIHMILRCNGQNGIESSTDEAKYIIDYLNDCAETAQEEF